MSVMRRTELSILAFGLMTSTAAAQSSSLWLLPPSDQQARPEAGTGPVAPAGFSAAPPREDSTPSTRSIEAVSLIAIPRMPPRKFKPHDLITIIVKQAKKRESEAKLDTEKKWKINGKLSDWFRFYEDHKLGSDTLPRGQPGFKFQYNNKYENDGQNEREDRFETRIQALVIDVKPNGNLVIEARQHETHDEEVIEITLTGVCRSQDITPANTILSTQIAEMVLVEQNSGAVRDATTRGWIPRLLDWAKPF
jgi:flagellar L-ring protein FlgH